MPCSFQDSFQFSTQTASYCVKVHIDKPVMTDTTDTSDTNVAANVADKSLNTTIIFLNALGVPLRKYNKVIHGLIDKGFSVVSADYPCCGENTPHVKRGIDYSYQNLVTQFIPSLVKIARGHTPDNRVVLMGHSLGGHIGTIYSVIHDTPVIGVACGTTYYKNWRGLGRIRILQAVAVIQALLKVYGYLPGHLIGMGDKEPKTQMNNWCRLAITGKFDFIRQDLNTGKGKALYINIDGDDYAPMSATKHLGELCAYYTIYNVKLDADLKGNPHGVWIKQPEVVIAKICDRLEDVD